MAVKRVSTRLLWLMFLVSIGLFGAVLVVGLGVIAAYRHIARACATEACLRSANSRKSGTLWGMFVGLVLFGTAWITFLILYKKRKGPAPPGGHPTFPGGRDLVGPVPEYDPLHGRGRDAAAVANDAASYFDRNSRATWDRPDPDGRVALHWAAYGQRDAGAFTAVLDAHPELANAPDKAFDTPLILAIEHGNIAAAQVLVGRAEVDVDAKNARGYSPLMYAAYFREADLAARLRDRTRERDTTAYGKSAHDIAALRGAWPVAARIMGVRPSFPRARDLLGPLPLYDPLHKRSNPPAAVLAQNAAYGVALADRPDPEGRTGLHWLAYATDNPAPVNALLTAYPQLLNQRDVNGDTALMIAIEHGNIQVARSLLAAGCNVTVTNVMRYNALMYAAYNGYTPLATAITNIDPTTAAANGPGITAPDLARLRGFEATGAAISAAARAPGPPVI